MASLGHKVLNNLYCFPLQVLLYFIFAAPRTCSVEAFRYFLGVDCDTAIIIANIMGVGLFGLIMVIGLIVVKKRSVYGQDSSSLQCGY